MLYGTKKNMAFDRPILSLAVSHSLRILPCRSADAVRERKFRRLKARQLPQYCKLYSKSGRQLTADNLHFLYGSHSNMEELLETEKSSSILDWLESVSIGAKSRLNLDNVGVPRVPFDRLIDFPPLPRRSLSLTVSSSAQTQE
jgi:hypothetical protein